MRAAIALAAAALVLAGCAPTPTEVSVRTYQVSGRDLDGLGRSLAMHGPRIPGQEGRAFAAAEIQFLHSFEKVENAGRCRFSRDGRVGLRTEVILPEWRNAGRASLDDQEKWDVLTRYAVIHEQGHIKISQKYARQVEAAYKRASAEDCASLDATIDRAVSPIAEAHDAEQRNFDATDGPRFRRFLRRNGYEFSG